LKAPLIAVISVGIAAAAPAVAISAKEPSRAAAPATAQSPVTDPHQPIGPVLIGNTTANHKYKQHAKLAKRFLKLRNRANRLIAKRDGHRKPKAVRTAKQVRWSNHALRHEIRLLQKRISRVKRHLRVRRAVLGSGVRAMLERIAACESHGNPRAIGGGGAFRGKYQFTFGTWATVGGKGDPAAAPESEQDRRAAMLLARSGSSPWPVCG
jgi:transglycosylase-like protein